MRIYYLIPDLYQKKRFSIRGLVKSIKDGSIKKYFKNCFLMKSKPVGGIKVIYQHCIILKELGYEVFPVLMGSYKGNFYGYDIESKKYKDVIGQITSSDIVVATEFEPYQGLLFGDARKILFVQNWLGLHTRLSEKDKEKSYLELGYDYVMTCSDYCTSYVRNVMHIPAVTVTNGIDLTKFFPNPSLQIKNRILAMSRKNPEDLKNIMKRMEKSGYEFRVVDRLTQAELIEEYQAADIFLATGYPEGFGLPPLEAMCCGCVVVGFTGGGASEFMRDGETALVVEDGDCESVVSRLTLLWEDTELKEHIRSNSLARSKMYSLDNTKASLKVFYENVYTDFK